MGYQARQTVYSAGPEGYFACLGLNRTDSLSSGGIKLSERMDEIQKFGALLREPKQISSLVAVAAGARLSFHSTGRCCGSGRNYPFEFASYFHGNSSMPQGGPEQSLALVRSAESSDVSLTYPTKYTIMRS